MNPLLRRALVPTLLLATWALAASFGPWPADLFPGPVAVLGALARMIRDGRLAAATARSISRLALGYGLSAAVGIPLGIAMARMRWMHSTLKPVLLGLQALPSICWLPLALLWFGPSEGAIVFVVVMGSVLAIAISTDDGVAAIDPLLLRAAGVLGIRGARFHLGVLVPAALPGIVTGLKLGWSFAWRALMAGELLYAAGGLGQLLQQGRAVRDVAQLFAVMVAIVALGAAVDQLLFRTFEVRIRRRWGMEEAT